MLAEVKKNIGSKEFPTPERCFINEVANDPGDQAISIARARVEPGVTTAWHKLQGTEERYIITQGHGNVELGNLAPMEVTEGDVVRIPADTRQRITNIGKYDLIFFAVCSPRFTKECYIELE